MQCLLQRYIFLAKISKTKYIAQAACDHIKDWYSGTKAGEWVSVLIYLNDGMNVHFRWRFLLTEVIVFVFIMNFNDSNFNH